MLRHCASNARRPPAPQPLAGAIGRLLYLVHLAVLMWWLLDKSARQRATSALVALFEGILPPAALTLGLPFVRRFVVAVDALVREALFGEPAGASGQSGRIAPPPQLASNKGF